MSTQPASSLCPICRRPTSPAGPAFPFCSPRCRQVDLIRWSEGKYTIERPLTGDDLDELAADDLAPGLDDVQDDA